MSITTVKQAKTAITSIKKSREALQAKIHEVAMFGLAHYKQHNDGSILSDLAKAVQKYNEKDGKFDARNSALRGESLRAWIKDFGGVKWSKNAYGTGGFVLDAKGKVTREEINLQEAESNPFWQYTEDKPATAMDPLQVVRQLRDRINKTVAGEAKQYIEPEQMALAATLVNGLSELLAAIDGNVSNALTAAAKDTPEVSKEDVAKMVANG